MTHQVTPNPLAGIRAKLERAEDLIATLDNQVKQIVESGQFTVRKKFHYTNRCFTFTASGPTLPPTFSVLTGEVIHHLRSVFDHLVWQLVLVNRNQPTERNEFPICPTREKFDEAIKRHKIDGVSASATSIIESLQPYHAATLEASWLWVVHELDRIDKHRLLVVLLAAMTLGQTIVMQHSNGPVIITGMSPPKWATPTMEGVEVFRIELGEPCPSEVVFDAQFQMNVCIDSVGTVLIPPLLPTLRGALVGVRSATQSFEQEFS